MHVGNCPTRHFDGKIEALGILAGKGGERFDGLGRALAVYRVTPIMVVFRTAIVLKKVLFVVVQPFAKIWTPRFVSRALEIALQAIEVVAGMEVVNPVIFRIFTILPGPVEKLTRATVFHGGAGNVNIVAIAGVFSSSGEHGGTQHVGIVD